MIHVLNVMFRKTYFATEKYIFITFFCELWDWIKQILFFSITVGLCLLTKKFRSCLHSPHVITSFTASIYNEIVLNISIVKGRYLGKAMFYSFMKTTRIILKNNNHALAILTLHFDIKVFWNSLTSGNYFFLG